MSVVYSFYTVSLLSGNLIEHINSTCKHKTETIKVQKLDSDTRTFYKTMAAVSDEMEAALTAAAGS